MERHNVQDERTATLVRSHNPADPVERALASARLVLWDQKDDAEAWAQARRGPRVRTWRQRINDNSARVRHRTPDSCEVVVHVQRLRAGGMLRWIYRWTVRHPNGTERRYRGVVNGDTCSPFECNSRPGEWADPDFTDVDAGRAPAGAVEL